MSECVYQKLISQTNKDNGRLPTTHEYFFLFLQSVVRECAGYLQLRQSASPSRQLFSFFHCRLLSLALPSIASNFERAKTNFCFFVSFHYNLLQLTFFSRLRQRFIASVCRLYLKPKKLSYSFLFTSNIFSFFICLWKRKTKHLLEWSCAKTILH